MFGVYAPETTDVAPLAYYALYALQHRGQESAGIAVNDDGVFTALPGCGAGERGVSAGAAPTPWARAPSP